MNNSSNNNIDHISSLSHLILHKILQCESLENIDRICFSLACKKLFQEKDKYLYYNVEYLNKKFNYLKSYHNIINKQLEKKNEYTKTLIFNKESSDSSVKESFRDALKEYEDHTGELVIDSNVIFDEVYPFDFSNCKFQILQLYVDNSLMPISFPPTMKSIIFGADFNQQLKPRIFCDSIEDIEFGDAFNQPIAEGVLPSNLRKLVFGLSFNSEIGLNALPNSLEELHFQRMYNQPLNYKLPKSLRYIKFSASRGSFNHEIKSHTFPEGLRSIQLLSRSYDHLLKPGVFPSTLESLTISTRFEQPLLVGTLPDNIMELKFESTYDGPIPSYFPKSLISLTLSEGQIEFIDTTHINLPTLLNLTKVIGFPISFLHLLPKSVTNLALIRRSEEPHLSANAIPKTVTKLFLTTDEIGDQTLLPGHFPEGIIKLNIRGYPFSNKSLFEPGVIPSSVELLDISSLDFTPNYFPETIKHLRLWNMKNELTFDVLPPRLITLFLSFYIYPMGDNILPHTLTFLDLSDCKQKTISKNAIRSPPPGESYAKLRISTHLFSFLELNPPQELPPSVFEVENPYYNLNFRRVDNNNWFLPNM